MFEIAMEKQKNNTIEALVRENVKRLKPYASARDEYVSDGTPMVFLDANENPFDDGLNRYPDPQQRKLKTLLSEQKGVSVSQILLGNGSDEVLDLIYRAFCEPGKDNIITLPPTYGMYKVLAGVNAVENREVLLSDDFEPEVESILATADANSKILFLCSPNNPTANSFNRQRIERLLNAFPGLVVIDEAYIDFSSQASWVASLNDYPRLIVTQTLSKAYGLAGIRLGICYASEEIITVLNKIKPPYNVNELTQQKAGEGLADSAGLQREVAAILSERETLGEALKAIPSVLEVFPSDANFLLARVRDAGKVYNALLSRGIVVRNRSTQPLCENTLRFTVGTQKENQELIQALKSI
jgi:histidinol-phosphate aminotransferase